MSALGVVGTDSVYRVGTPSRCTDSPHRSYERTNGRTNKRLAHVTNKSSLTDTCGHVQDFDDLEFGQMSIFSRRVVNEQEKRYEEARAAPADLLRDVEWDIEILHPASLPPVGIRNHQIEGER